MQILPVFLQAAGGIESRKETQSGVAHSCSCSYRYDQEISELRVITRTDFFLRLEHGDLYCLLQELLSPQVYQLLYRSDFVLIA